MDARNAHHPDTPYLAKVRNKLEHKKYEERHHRMFDAASQVFVHILYASVDQGDAVDVRNMGNIKVLDMTHGKEGDLRIKFQRTKLHGAEFVPWTEFSVRMLKGIPRMPVAGAAPDLKDVMLLPLKSDGDTDYSTLNLNGEAAKGFLRLTRNEMTYGDKTDPDRKNPDGSLQKMTGHAAQLIIDELVKHTPHHQR